MTRVISICNQKGGVGKTTCAINLAAALVRRGKRCLLVDMDPTASLSVSLGYPFEVASKIPTIYQVMFGKNTAKEAIITVDGIDVIPSWRAFFGAEQELSPKIGREFALQKALDPVRNDYDFIFIDCPPFLGLLTVNALVFSHEVFIPISADYLSMDGAVGIINTIAEVKQYLNPKLTLSGIIITRLDRRRNEAKQVIEMVTGSFPDITFKQVIGESASLSEAPRRELNVFAYKPESNGAKDYLALADEILDKEKNNG